VALLYEKLAADHRTVRVPVVGNVAE